MLYLLFQYLIEHHGFPMLGAFPSFRIGASFFTAFLICLLFGRRFIEWQRGRSMVDGYAKLGEARKELILEGKAGTPTMGGLLTSAAILGAAFLWMDPREPLGLAGLCVFLACGAIGYYDDYVKLCDPVRHGIPWKRKILLLAAVGLGLGSFLFFFHWTGEEAYLRSLVLPFLKNPGPTEPWLGLAGSGGIFFLLLVAFVLVGSANAVNLSDGMDGLAAGMLVISGIALVGICYLVGDLRIARYLYVLHVPGCKEVAVLMGGFVGAALGFLWWNASPAELFMGDVGSLGFGALLGFAGIASRMEIFLAVVGGLFVAEALSVLLQVGSFRLRRRRIFLCSPVHHHFQKLGMPETKIVARFWIVSALLAVFSLLLVKFR